MKRILFTIVSCLVVLGILFAGAELWLRQNGCKQESRDEDIYVFHPTLGWIGKPDTQICRCFESTCETYGFNSLGFRGADRSFDNPSDSLRILVLGDSFLEGYQFPDKNLLTTHLEKLVEKRTGRSTEVINMGLVGWGTAQQYLAYRDIGSRFEPDLVILLFCSGNDIIDSSKTFSHLYPVKTRLLRPFFSLNEGQPELELPSEKTMLENKRLLEKQAKARQKKGAKNEEAASCTRVGAWLNQRWDNPTGLRLLLDRWGLVGYSENMPHGISHHPRYHGLILRYWIYLPNSDSVWQKAIEVEENIITQLAHSVRENHSRFVMVMGANMEQVIPKTWELTLQTYPWMKNVPLDLELPDKQWSRFAQQNGLPFLSLVPELKAATQNGENLYFRNDGHWNAKGQKRVAETIARYLFSNELL